MNSHALKISMNLGLSILLTSLSVYAQSSNTMIVKIPFKFVAGKTTLPSGEYTVKSLSPSSIQILRTDNRKSAIVLVIPVQTRKSPEVATLVFDQYGDQYFLSKLWTPASKTGRELLRSPLERDLAKGKSEHRIVTITALSEGVDVKLNFD
jgi:hypothetical protein